MCTLEQRAVIKFGFKLNKSTTQTFQMPKTAYGDVCLRRSKTVEWYSQFKNGRDSLEDNPRERCPLIYSNDKNMELVRSALSRNHRISVRKYLLE